jgi:hypothetical protein
MQQPETPMMEGCERHPLDDHNALRFWSAARSSAAGAMLRRRQQDVPRDLLAGGTGRRQGVVARCVTCRCTPRRGAQFAARKIDVHAPSRHNGCLSLR